MWEGKENSQRKLKTSRIIRDEKDRLREERRKSRQHSYEAYVNSQGELRIRSAGAKQSREELTEEEIDVDGLEDEEEENQYEFDMKASEYVNLVLKRDPAPDRSAPGSRSGERRERSLRSKVGRPKGSRSFGISRVKKVNPNLVLSDELMGEECGIENCAVRLKVYFALFIAVVFIFNSLFFKCKIL